MNKITVQLKRSQISTCQFNQYISEHSSIIRSEKGELLIQHKNFRNKRQHTKHFKMKSSRSHILRSKVQGHVLRSKFQGQNVDRGKINS